MQKSVCFWVWYARPSRWIERHILTAELTFEQAVQIVSFLRSIILHALVEPNTDPIAGDTDAAVTFEKSSPQFTSIGVADAGQAASDFCRSAAVSGCRVRSGFAKLHLLTRRSGGWVVCSTAPVPPIWTANRTAYSTASGDRDEVVLERLAKDAPYVSSCQIRM